MGEKGIAGEVLGGAGVPTAGLVERTTTVVASTVTSAGEDVIDKIRDKGIEAAAEGVIDQARESLRKPETPNDPA